MPMNKGSLSVLFIDDHQYLFTTRHHNGDEDGIIQNNQIHRQARLRRKAIEQSLTLDQILKNARAMEVAEEQTIQIEKEQSNAVQYCVHTKSHYPKPVSEAKRSSQCGLCGGSYPHKGQCPAKGRRCLTCDKLNHFAKMCRSRAVSNEKPAQKKSYRRPKQRARAVTIPKTQSRNLRNLALMKNSTRFMSVPSPAIRY